MSQTSKIEEETVGGTVLVSSEGDVRRELEWVAEGSVAPKSQAPSGK